MFRSHLMQQFATAARGQSRPPLALFGISGHDEEVNKGGSGDLRHDGAVRTRTRYSETNTTVHVNHSRDYALPRSCSTTPNGPRLKRHPNAPSTPPPSPPATSTMAYHSSSSNSTATSTLARMYSTTTTTTTRQKMDDTTTVKSVSQSTTQQPQQPQNFRHFTSVETTPHPDSDQSQLQKTKCTTTTDSSHSHMMQSLMMSRRTISAFEPLPSSDNHIYQKSLKESLDRAVQCGMNAPNHKKTEPFRFKRLLAPSSKTQELAHIAYQVKYYQKPTCENNQRLAQRKLEKWNTIPGFLVALVHGQPPQEEDILRPSKHDNTHVATLDATPPPPPPPLPPQDDQQQHPESSSLPLNNNRTQFETLPFVGPSTERQLEDYAATCAALQNIMLSLHAEGIGSKWATGPVVRTKAFRSLIKAKPDEMVVGLLMVGYPHSKRGMPKPPRRTKSIDDLLEDL
eukprot:CAMPEP_0195287652 /NCGR_PEP_ID=MMETSP0707-20130614/4626_1 /TAXON_ID=33640 /ORGANISM="Asterionellopsis glacialis, Strain CCMP134" /LENGTH=454 /DNA_ID=CAMNT_0040347429 /DNA_START=77 /DNA_END=1441 /DNA_ORIENTATION=+